MKLLLIDPPGDARGVSIGLAYVATSAKCNGHDVKVLNLNNDYEMLPTKKLKRMVMTFKPDVIGFTIMCHTYNIALSLIADLRNYYHRPVIIGGVQVAVDQEQILIRSPGTDYVMVGEAEDSINLFLDAIKRRSGFENVPGLIFRKKNKIMKSRIPKGFINDLNTTPIPDYGLFGIKQMDNYLMITSRGCPFNCIYCFHDHERTWRKQSVDKTIKEIKIAIEKYKSKTFVIVDQCFNLNVKYVEEFCDKLIAEKLKISWVANGIRADRLPLYLVKKMKQAGCIKVILGIETLVPEIFKNIKKGEQIEDIVKSVQTLKKCGIRVKGNFIIGLPGDTYSRTMENFKKARSLKLDEESWAVLLPMPGTEVFNWAKTDPSVRNYATYKEVDMVWSPTLGIDVAFDTLDFTREERLKAYKIITTKTRRYMINPKHNPLINFFKVMRDVLKYDPWRFFYHLSLIFTDLIPIYFKGVYTRNVKYQD